MPLQDFFCKKPASGKVIGQKMNKTAILAEDLPLFAAELLGKLLQLQAGRRGLQSKVSGHCRGNIIFQDF